MKMILNLKKSVFVIAALAACVSLTSCDSDDDPKPLVLDDVNGNYTGKLYLKDVTRAAASPITEEPAADVTAEIKDGKIEFADFPVYSLLVAIEGEDNATEIQENMEAVAYSVGYTAKLNQAQDSIYITLADTPLEFTYSIGEGNDKVENAVKVTLKATESGGSYSGKKLELGLTSEKVTVNEELLDPYDKEYFFFKLNKK